MFDPAESITLAQYWMGRDRLFPRELSGQIQSNAQDLVQRVNRLLGAFYVAQRHLGLDPGPPQVNSGWRPPAINARTAGAARQSAHMTGQAVDLRDDAEMLDQWCNTMGGKTVMEACGLYREHPDATPRWCHLQTRRPQSGDRTFWP